MQSAITATITYNSLNSSVSYAFFPAKPSGGIHIIAHIFSYYMYFFLQNGWWLHIITRFYSYYMYPRPKSQRKIHIIRWFFLNYMYITRFGLYAAASPAISFRLVCCSLSCHIISACMLQRLLPYHFGLCAAAPPAISFLFLFPGLHFTCSGLYAYE